MKKKLLLGTVVLLLFLSAGCGKSKNEDFHLTLNNQLPLQIRNIYIENDKDNNVLVAQDIPMWNKANFQIDGSLKKVKVVITPKDMFAYSLDLEIDNKTTHSGVYNIVLDGNEIILQKEDKK